MKKETKVIISFDAEFSINGAFSDPYNKTPSSKYLFSPSCDSELGLQQILNILKSHNVPATFFTEALNTMFFDNSEMGVYVKKIFEHGHDVQLHAHPCWLAFQNPDWKEAVNGKKVSDTFGTLEIDDILIILEHCLQVFKSWNVPRPTAFRAGNLFAVRVLYEALKEKKFHIASNISLAIHTPKELELRIENTSAKFSELIELPVTTFESMGFRQKSLTITGTSFSEITDVINESIKNDIEYVVVLTHIHEYIKYSEKNINVKRNRVNLNRLENLCKFVNNHSSLRFTTFGALANEPQFMNIEHNASSRKIKTSLMPGLITIIENFLNDKIWDF